MMSVTMQTMSVGRRLVRAVAIGSPPVPRLAGTYNPRRDLSRQPVMDRHDRAYCGPPDGRSMAPRITIIGGGSYQWTPKLLVDFVNTPALADAEIVLHDIDAEPLPRMVELARHLAGLRGVGLTASATTDRAAALDDAEYVVVNIS